MNQRQRGNCSASSIVLGTAGGISMNSRALTCWRTAASKSARVVPRGGNMTTNVFMMICGLQLFRSGGLDGYIVQSEVEFQDIDTWVAEDAEVGGVGVFMDQSEDFV